MRPRCDGDAPRSIFTRCRTAVLPGRAAVNGAFLLQPTACTVHKSDEDTSVPTLHIAFWGRRLRMAGLSSRASGGVS